MSSDMYEEPCISIFGAIGKSLIGIQLISQPKEPLDSSLLAQVSQFLYHPNLDFKITAVNSLTKIFGARFSYSEVENDTLISIYNSISERISQNSNGIAQFILESLQKPFYELRKSCYSLVKALICPNAPFAYTFQALWRIGKVRECPGLLEFLLNRNTENVTEGLHIRYEIFLSFIQLINTADDLSLQSSSLVNLLGTQLYHTISYYLKQGAVYVPIKATPIVEDTHF